MDSPDNNSAVICEFCGEPFTLPDDEVDGNFPRVLVCGHIFCTSCLLSIQHEGTIRCPDCEVKSILPDGGVNALQEDSRIVGLIYTAKMNKSKNLRCEKMKNRKWNKLPSPDVHADAEDMKQPFDLEKTERMVDEALVQAARNLTLLKHILETLQNGHAEQVKRDRTRVELEIKQSADKAMHTVQKWKDMQLSQLTKWEERFSTSQVALGCVQERIKSLDIAMQMAREVRRVPILQKYCTLDKVLETLRAPVEKQSFNTECVTVGSGLSFVFQSEDINQSLALSLKMETSHPKHLSECPPKGHRLGKSPWQCAEGRNRDYIPPSHNNPPIPQTQDQCSPGTNCSSPPGSSPSPKPRRRARSSPLSSASDLTGPDVIVEEIIDQGITPITSPPTGPELANDKWRSHRRRKNQMFGNQKNVTQWVVVTHVVNPSHFYVRYVAEKREGEILSKKINHFCSFNRCRFTSRDTVETGSLIFVKQKEGLWCRARVAEVTQKGSVEAVKACPVIEIYSISVFLFDCGLTIDLNVQSEDQPSECPLKTVNNHLRKVCMEVKAELCHFAPQAIRCSLKDLVPYELSKGWSEMARVEFYNVVGSAAVEMRLLGQDRDSLLVDLKKPPMDQSSHATVSIREYLVFIEVARFYSPVSLGRKPLSYYPPVYPKINTEVNAVVSHINSPDDFYIQLVDSMESLLLSAKLQECYNTTTADGEGDLRIYCPVIEQAYVARYEDKLWYRAQLIGNLGEGKVEVRYVDFGNKKTLPVSDLRKIKDEFFALPSMAIHCCLSEVCPVDGENWSEACTKRLISLAHQKLVTIVATGSVPKTEPLPIKLFESGLSGPLANIAELLVEEELACFREGQKSKDVMPAGDGSAIWDPPIDLGVATEDVAALDQKVNGEEDAELPDLQAQLKGLAQLKDVKVRVSHVKSPSSFYVQLVKSNSQLKRMCELVKKECANMEPDDDMVWKADMYCGAHINGVWERGQICSDVTSSKIAEVMRCDHGNKVKIHVSNLRLLPSSLIGSLALECTLTGIRPAGGRSTWTATACDLISCYLTGASAIMTIEELKDKRPQPVTLSCSDRMGQLVSIADFLASEGLALKERKARDAVDQKPQETETESPASMTQTVGDDGDMTQILPNPSSPSVPSTPPPVCGPNHPRPAPRTFMSAAKVNTQLYNPPELPCLGHIQINVSAIGEDGIIYVRTKNAECQLEQLRQRIQVSMKSLPRQKPFTWKSVHGCAVIGSDMLWYRGQLLEVLRGHVKVQYVDYGMVENIPVVHVYPVLLCEDIPQLCMPCQLHNINPVGDQWHSDAVALLREILLNRCVDMQVMELPSDPRGPLMVELFIDGMGLSRIVCHYEHASMTQTVSAQEQFISPPQVLDDWDIDTERLRGPEEPMLGPFMYPELPQEGTHFKVRVKHLQTPNELFLWPLEGIADVTVDGETLDEAVARIHEDIDNLPQLTTFPQGGPCLAEYCDGKYYRAKLMKIATVEPVLILVQHVDFGSDDTLPPSKLRQMPPELMGFPPRALKVKVAGFKPPSIQTEGVMLPYSPKWSVKATMEMMDLLHSNITACCVAREPLLTVLLFNEDKELIHLTLVGKGLADFE